MWGISTYQMSAESTTQQRGNSPGYSWRLWKRLSWNSWWGSQLGRVSWVPLDHLFVSREGLVGDVVVGGCPGHSSRVFGSRRAWTSEGRLWSLLEGQAKESLGVSHKGQRSLGRLDVLWKGNLKAAGADCPQMSQWGTVIIGWLNREIWVELGKKRRICKLQEKRKATQEDYK